MLSHLVYISTRKPTCTEEEIEKILTACQKNNKEIDITGVLLYSPMQFLQYIEGPYSVIISLYDKIKTDNRHKNAVLISSAPIVERCFPSWQMGSKQFNSHIIEFNSNMTDSEKDSFRAILGGKTMAGNKADRAYSSRISLPYQRRELQTYLLVC